VSKIRRDLLSQLVPVPLIVKMEVSNHPELQEKLQELEHELEVSRSVSKEKCFETVAWVGAVLLRPQVACRGLVPTNELLLTFDINRREILQKRGRQSLVYAGQTEHSPRPAVVDICF
jgi:hypothetical protein